ncbi:Pyridoxal 4-dehydrogenase [Rosistilla ulvae]|uniref:Pyridoxal 4-dehydrogenase n=1 Tax=Rosistilla ulvae TaxID=1930277 RepID=A0A517M5Y4_9BACT|nr:aldo/keto reductase [Rosistilla ulvae]QDS90281.1 Pyridoxal 4-dehydrogenase [Rosistilla ulvae]
MQRQLFGKTGLRIPPVVFGSTSLGNLFAEVPDEAKQQVVAEWFRRVEAPVFIDSAGKYGAGMSLEIIGRELSRLNIDPADVVISNKLAWTRQPLVGDEPTFEPGAWFGLTHDARQEISYEGILRCYHQGNELLGDYQAGLVSVHDPDEYLAAATDPADRKQRWHDIEEAYRALGELRSDGKVLGVGVGAKDWTSIRDVCDRVDLDWVMLANSLTIMKHPPELLAFIEQLDEAGVGILNAAVFNAGFALGGKFYDYRVVTGESAEDRELLDWRQRFQTACQRFDVAPAAACLEFARSVPGIQAVAISSSSPHNIARTVAAVDGAAPPSFWSHLKEMHVIDPSFPFLG